MGPAGGRPARLAWIRQAVSSIRRRSPFSARAHDVQYSFGVSHREYLPVAFRLNHLPSFTMYRAFPGSDYYCQRGLPPPRRQSRIPF